MSEEEDTSTAGLGERRRRREAERARARAAGLERPLSRRELRARDEALASGALQLGPDGPVPTPMSATSALSAHTAPSAATPASGGPRRRATGAVSSSPTDTATDGAAGPDTATTGTATDGAAGQDTATTVTESDAAAAAAPATTGPASEGAAIADPASTDTATDGTAPADPPSGASDTPSADEAQAAPVPADPDSVPSGPARPGPAGPAASAAPLTSDDAIAIDATSEDSTAAAATADADEESSAGVSRAGAPSAESAATTGEFGAVSRRSLRAKQASADAEPTTPEAPSERTSTGRRPVVRPPAAARATRGLDETGGLTPIQRAVRDINAAPDAAPEPLRAEIVAERSPAATPGPLPTADAASVWGSDAPDETAVLPVQSDEPAKAEADLLYDGGPLPSTRRSRRNYEAVATPADAAVDQDAAGQTASTEPEDVEDEDDAFDMRPRWASVISGEPEPAADEQPEAGATAGARDEFFDDDLDEDDYDDEDEDDERTPAWLRALQIIVLILVGLVLGLLVWQVASGNVFGGDGLGALVTGVASSSGS
ncbi:hypothetical protein [Occultella kanbiaonis]|uniref:hypothetical protein n=1 Tax=Occultella kanbiaonis TaxID=2675754 RepID=UPI0012B9A1E3|nr:hypothetical protein [Occultella kanbiaonis]